MGLGIDAGLELRVDGVVVGLPSFAVLNFKMALSTNLFCERRNQWYAQWRVTLSALMNGLRRWLLVLLGTVRVSSMLLWHGIPCLNSFDHSCNKVLSWLQYGRPGKSRDLVPFHPGPTSKVMETRPKGVLREAAFDGSKDLREAPLVGRLVVVVRPVVVVAQDKMVLEEEEKVALSATTGVDMRKVCCRVSMFCFWRVVAIVKGRMPEVCGGGVGGCLGYGWVLQAVVVDRSEEQAKK
jgi:hypothetical protein